MFAPRQHARYGSLAAGLLCGLALLGTDLGTSSASPGRTAVDLAFAFPSDGHRYVSYMRPDQVPVVFDTWQHETREIHAARGCPPRSVGGGKVLLICDQPGYKKKYVKPARIASVRGGKSWKVPHSGRRQIFDEIGRFWIKGSHFCESPSSCGVSTEYTNWRTGARRILDPQQSGFYRDVSSRQLRPLPKAPFVPDVHIGLDTYGDCYNQNVVVTDLRDELTLWRSPHDPTVIGKGGVISFECEFDQTFSISSGRITWVNRRGINAVNIRTLKHYRRHVKRLNSSITPVRDGVVIAVPLHQGRHHSRYRIRFVNLK